MPSRHRFTTAPGEAGRRLDTHPGLVEAAGSRSRLQALARQELLLVDGRPRPGRHRLVEGSVLELEVPDTEPSHLEPEDLPLSIVYRDEQVLVVDKPAGMVVHPGAGHRSGTMVNALLHHVPDLRGVGTDERPGLVHRLDRDTSGLLVVARSAAALRRLQACFKERSVSRRYLALCLGPRLDDELLLDTPYGRHPKDRKKFTSRQGSRRAVTRVRVLWRERVAALVEARLETGRSHQLRVHLGDTGHPIVADLVYGRQIKPAGYSLSARLRARAPRLALHAASLSFPHPATGEAMSFTSPPPPELNELLRAWMGGEAWEEAWASFSAP